MSNFIEFIKKYYIKIIIVLIILIIILSVVISPYILCILLIFIPFLYIKSNKKFSLKKSKTDILTLLDKYEDTISVSKKGSGDLSLDDRIYLNKKINKKFIKIIEDTTITDDETMFLVLLLKINIKNKYNIDLIDCIEDPDLKKDYLQIMEYAKNIDIYKFQDYIKMHFKYEIDRSIINDFPKNIQLDVYYLRYLLNAIDDITNFNTTNYADLYVIDQLKKRSEDKDYRMISIIYKYNNADDKVYSDELYNYIYESPVFKKLYTKLSKIDDIDISNVFSAKSLKNQIGILKYGHLINQCIPQYNQPEDEILDCMVSLDPKNYNYYIELYNNAIKYLANKKREEYAYLEQNTYPEQNTYTEPDNNSEQNTNYNSLSKDNYSVFIKNTNENRTLSPVA